MFEYLYPKREMEHFGMKMVSRTMFGSEEYLDGYSVYTLPKGYKHVVNFALSELYTNEDASGNASLALSEKIKGGEINDEQNQHYLPRCKGYG